MARKPLSENTVAENVMKWGTGAINIDDSRIKTGNQPNPAHRTFDTNQGEVFELGENKYEPNELGRFPSNIIFDEVASEILDDQTGIVNNGHWPINNTTGYGLFGGGTNTYIGSGKKDNTKFGASKFFYCPKASTKDRNSGLGDPQENKVNEGSLEYMDTPSIQDEIVRKNIHPTVKPTELMQYLVRLVTPKNGICADVFFGSGSTGKACIREGFKFIGIEKEKNYFEISIKRCEAELNQSNSMAA